VRTEDEWIDRLARVFEDAPRRRGVGQGAPRAVDESCSARPDLPRVARDLGEAVA